MMKNKYYDNSVILNDKVQIQNVNGRKKNLTYFQYPAKRILFSSLWFGFMKNLKKKKMWSGSMGVTVIRHFKKTPKSGWVVWE